MIFVMVLCGRTAAAADATAKQQQQHPTLACEVHTYSTYTDISINQSPPRPRYTRMLPISRPRQLAPLRLPARNSQTNGPKRSLSFCRTRRPTPQLATLMSVGSFTGWIEPTPNASRAVSVHPQHASPVSQPARRIWPWGRAQKKQKKSKHWTAARGRLSLTTAELVSPSPPT